MTENKPECERLTDGDVQDRKPQGWWGDDGKLFRLFEFDSYRQGLDFVVRVAELAEAQNHHPDITLKYKKVHVEYVTHETNSIVGGVTELDLWGAEAVNSIYQLPGEVQPGER